MLSGPNLINSCYYGAMVTSPTGDGVVLLGCSQSPGSIYRMSLDENGDYQWMMMEQSLKYPRSYLPIVNYIEDHQVICN